MPPIALHLASSPAQLFKQQLADRTLPCQTARQHTSQGEESVYSSTELWLSVESLGGILVAALAVSSFAILKSF